MRRESVIPWLLLGWLVPATGCGDGAAPPVPQLELVSAAEPPLFNRVLLVDDGSDGDRLRVAVLAEDVADLFAGGFAVTYDPAMLELVSASAPSELRAFGTSFGKDGFAPGELLVGFALEDPRDSLVIASLTFAPLVAGESELGFAAPVRVEDRESRWLVDRRGTKRVGVRWFGGVADATDWDGGDR